MRQLLLLAAAAALTVTSACTRKNRNYCDDAPYYNCDLRTDGAVDAPGAGVDAVDTVEAPGQPTDAAGDGGGDADATRECDAERPCTSPTRPICDAVRGVCLPCVTDGQCVARSGDPQPGVCVDGMCPPRGEVIFVEFRNMCLPNGGGTLEAPFCTMSSVQGQLDRADEMRRIVLVRGDQPSWSLTATRRRVWIIGQPAAKVSIAGPAGISLVGPVDVALRRFEVSAAGSGGAFPGINISAGATVDLQEVVVAGGQVAGIQASFAKSVRLNRVLLTGNVTGLQLTQTPFEVTNTIIAGSMTGAVLDATGGPAAPRFQNNTLVDNMVPLSCLADHAVSALLVYPAPPAGLASSRCSVRTSNTLLPQFSTMDPAKPYRLTRGSPCTGMGDVDGFPLDDYDGETRPMGGASDCGADEFTE